MVLTLLVLDLGLPGCRSLKEKRGRLKPVLHGLQQEFELSAAEVDRQDDWDSSIVACALVSTSAVHNDAVLQRAMAWIDAHYKNIILRNGQIEQR
jgi:uncharacterized protein